MIVCPNCNKELSEGSRFCDGCGAKINETVFCQNCGKQISAESVFCEGCGMRINGNDEQASVSAAAPVVSEAPSVTAEAPSAAPAVPKVKVPKVKKKLPKKALMFGAIGVAVIAIAVVVILLLNGAKKSTNNFVMYIKDAEMFVTDLNKGGSAWQVSSQLALGGYSDSEDMASAGAQIKRYTQISEDGSLIFYPDKIDFDYRGFNLYYRRVNSSVEEAVKIDSDVRQYSINSSATVVTYIKGDDGRLYQYSLSGDTKEKIASDVEGFMASEDGEKILYFKSEHSIYVKNADGETQKIASDVSDVEYVSADLTTVYYTRENALYKQVEGEDRVKIASDIYRIVALYESGEVYYIKNTSEEVSLMDYVSDDMKASDAAMTEPVRPESPEYPYSWNYDTYEEYEKAYAEYEKAYAEYEKALQAYDAAREAYWAKEDRDRMRNDLEDRTVQKSSYSLCFFDGEKEVVITDSFDEESYYSFCEAAVGSPVIIYKAYVSSELNKVKLSEIESVYELEEKVIESFRASSKRYIAVNEKATEFKQENVVNPIINFDGTSIYFFDKINGETSSGELYCVSVKDGEIGAPELYESDVYSGYCYFTSDEKLIYFKDVKNGKGELYVDKTRVDYDVKVTWIDNYEEFDMLVYYTDWNEGKSYGTLKIYQDGEAVKVADDVYENGVTSDGRILYLNDYSLNYYKGALYEWDDGDSRKIEDDVSCFFPF